MNSNNNGQTDISSRALLVWLTISTWSARRYDKTVTQKVNRQYASSDDAGRYNKMLLPGDCPAYKTLTTIAGSIRAAHYGHTLAWSDEGWRLLPTANYMTYTQWFREQEHEFDRALDSFVNDYPSMQRQAERLLNGLYKSEDYPDAQDLRKRFKLGISYSPVPISEDIRVNLGADQIEIIGESIRAKIHDATKTAMNDAYQRLYDVVARMVNRLSDPEAIFRDSLVTNAKDVCESLKALNITNDAELEAMRVRVEKDLTRFDPDLLRDRAHYRQQTADKAKDILSQMSGLFTVQS